MISQSEIRELIAAARQRGAIIRTWHEEPGDLITKVMVRRGMPNVGTGWMPLILASEHLREFLATDANARLVAAVPDLLTCLRELSAVFSRLRVEPDRYDARDYEMMVNKTDAAIATAEGR